MRSLILWLTLLLIFFVPSERMVSFGSLGTLSNVIGLLVGGLWCIHFLAQGVRKLTSFHALVGAFVLLNAVSSFWTADPDLTAHRVSSYIRLASLTVIFWDIFRSSESIQLALQAYVFGGLVPALSTINNYLNNVTDFGGRFAATSGGKNETAFILALTIPAAIYLAVGISRSWGPKWLRWINFGCAFISLFAITLTGSRFALVMSVPVAVYMMRNVTRFRPLHAIAVAAVTAGGLIAVTQLIPEDAYNRLATMRSEITTGDLTGRTAIWKLGLESFAEHPLLGVGAGAERTTTFALGEPRAMHSSYLTILVDLGLIGFLLFTAILGTAVLYACQMPRNESAFWLTVLAAWGLGNLVCSDIDTKHTWVFLSLLVAQWGATRDRQTSQDSFSLPTAATINGHAQNSGLIPESPERCV